MKLKITYTITGTFEENSDDILESADVQLEPSASEQDVINECKEIISDDPFVNFDPLTEGKISLIVEKVQLEPSASEQDVINECKEIISDDPFVNFDPLTEGKISLIVEKA